MNRVSLRPLVVALLAACIGPDRDAETGTERPLVDAILHHRIPSAQWRTVTTPHFRLHVRAGSESEGRVAALRDTAEAARQLVLHQLGIPDSLQSERVDLVFADTRAEMQRLVGRPTAGMVPSDPPRMAFLLAGADYRPLFRHELTHVYTLAAWGVPPREAAWLSEGLATWATGTCAGVSLDARAADLARRGTLIPLPELLRRFGSLPEPVAYVGAGSVLGFVLRRDSTRTVIHGLWRAPADAHLRGFPELFGPGGADVERKWRAHLDTVPAHAVDTVTILEHGC